MIQCHRVKSNHNGFSLIELLVTFILSSIMIAGATFTYIHFLDYQDPSLSNLEMQRQGVYALSEMENEIKKGNEFIIGNFDGGINNMITVTTEDTGDKIYYQHGNAIMNDQGITIIPDTHIAALGRLRKNAKL